MRAVSHVRLVDTRHSTGLAHHPVGPARLGVDTYGALDDSLTPLLDHAIRHLGYGNAIEVVGLDCNDIVRFVGCASTRIVDPSVHNNDIVARNVQIKTATWSI